MYPLPVFVFVFIPTSRPQQSLWCWKRQGSPQHGFNNKQVEDVQAGLSKGRQIRDQIANIRLIIEKARKFQKDIYPCFIDYTKAFDCVDHNKLWKALKRWEYKTILSVSWDTHIQVKKQQLETCMELQLGSRLRKQYVRAICCHPVFLAYMLSTSWEMLGWMNYKLESR